MKNIWNLKLVKKSNIFKIIKMISENFGNFKNYFEKLLIKYGKLWESFNKVWGITKEFLENLWSFEKIQRKFGKFWRKI